MQLSKYTGEFLGVAGGISSVVYIIATKDIYIGGIVLFASILFLIIKNWDNLAQKIDIYNLREERVENFVKGLNLKDVSSIDILTHTGLNTFATLRKLLETGKYKDIQVRVLVHDTSYEIERRINFIAATVRSILELKNDGYDIHVQFYHGLPTFRSIIVSKKRNGTVDKKAFISWYRFGKESSVGARIANSEKFGRAFIFPAKQFGIINQNREVESVNENAIVDLVEGWFNRYWGKSEEGDIHTIIFDFDDTLVLTHDCQIQAWATAVRNLRNSLGENADKKINEDILDVIDDNDQFMNTIGIIFFEEESAQRIMDRLFVNLTEAEKNEINDSRFGERIRLMNYCQFTNDARNTIINLAENYHLGIVSATSSDLISTWLAARNMNQYFSVVFGKHEEVAAWKDISRKSLLIYQICNMLGVPPSRMLYVGDRDGDYIASSAIGVDFAEARLFSAELMNCIGRGSSLPREHQKICFNDWKNFDRSIDQIIKRKQRRMSAFAGGARIVEPMILTP